MVAGSNRGWDVGGRLAFGALGGLLLILAGAILAAPAVVALAVGVGARPRPYGASGTLVGWGAVWLAFMVNALAGCDPRSCRAPDPSGFLGLSGALVGAGLLLALAPSLVRPPTVRLPAALASAVRALLAVAAGALAAFAGLVFWTGGVALALVVGYAFLRPRIAARRWPEIALFGAAAGATAALLLISRLSASS